ncbi:hypothetical protein DSM04_105229 [Leeuwenhoekiella aestuarii]|uniref:Uncharacterized protein n=1 Tax=Leeuwenhoekiella aestuarii TaxID=2249426 RepID=A0A4V1KP20_9FLAO|nr:hypothetical protein DSM04_105229 [Leeuwenhoekiella aestuarii]
MADSIFSNHIDNLLLFRSHQPQLTSGYLITKTTSNKKVINEDFRIPFKKGKNTRYWGLLKKVKITFFIRTKLLTIKYMNYEKDYFYFDQPRYSLF